MKIFKDAREYSGGEQKYFSEFFQKQINSFNDRSEDSILNSLSEEECGEYVVNTIEYLCEIGEGITAKEIWKENRNLLSTRQLNQSVANLPYEASDPITEKTIESIMRQSDEYGMPVRWTLGIIWTDKGRKEYEEGVMSKPLPE